MPQGSVLGPLLFNIFINDIVHILKCPFLLYADDLKIYMKISAPEDCEKLQSDIDSLYNWCLYNKLQLNINKCNFISFTNRLIPLQQDYKINNITLIKVDTIKDLGVIFDSKLRFDLHIENIINKVFKMLGFVLRSTKDFNNTKCINILYNSLVRPQLEYCSVVWNPHHANCIQKIERVQRIFTKNIWFRSHTLYQPYEIRYNHLKINTLQKRRIYFDMNMLYNIVNSESELKSHIMYRDNPYPNRQKCLFQPPFKRTDYGKFINPTVRIQHTFNQYIHDPNVFNLTIERYKEAMRKQLKFL